MSTAQEHTCSKITEVHPQQLQLQKGCPHLRQLQGKRIWIRIHQSEHSNIAQWQPSYGIRCFTFLYFRNNQSESIIYEFGEDSASVNTSNIDSALLATPRTTKNYGTKGRNMRKR